uniref:Uncharacterized protein n=1 Tax=Arundo donax TaxID=35708 RepID=A0A0A9BWV3_ARUDO
MQRHNQALYHHFLEKKKHVSVCLKGIGAVERRDGL